MSDSETRPGGPGSTPPPDGATTPASGSSAKASTPPTKSSTKSSAAPDPLRSSRTSGLWVAVVLSGLILVLLIIFIAQNTDPVSIRFLGWEGETPLAVAILGATVAGLFLAAVAGSLRILQLRRRVKRESR